MSLIAETSMVTGLADVFCCFQIKYCETLSPDRTWGFALSGRQTRELKIVKNQEKGLCPDCRQSAGGPNGKTRNVSDVPGFVSFQVGFQSTT